MKQLPQWVVKMIVSYVVKKLAKYGSETDFEKIKIALKPKIISFVWGTFLDDAAILTVYATIDALQLLLQASETLEKIGTYVANEQWGEMLELLKKLVTKSYQGEEMPMIGQSILDL
jgi:hypothetical protein